MKCRHSLACSAFLIQHFQIHKDSWATSLEVHCFSSWLSCYLKKKIICVCVCMGSFTNSVNGYQNGMERERGRERSKIKQSTHTRKIIVAIMFEERHNNSIHTFKKENGWGVEKLVLFTVTEFCERSLCVCVCVNQNTRFCFLWKLLVFFLLGPLWFFFFDEWPSLFFVWFFFICEVVRDTREKNAQQKSPQKIFIIFFFVVWRSILCFLPLVDVRSEAASSPIQASGTHFFFFLF